VEPEDAENYQTVFAKCEGAVAAPTAGMHFSKSLMKHLELRDVQFAELTLHTGVGNFREIEVEDLTKHKTDSEEMEITQEACDIINAAKAERHKIFAVGTTSLKALETSVTISGQINPYKGWTNKFIFPHYDFNTADALITNFHLPKSSMMMEVAAFAGYDLLMKAYKTAVAEKYRFFTYGDAMLIL
jgi:S-adenosylmethionine:tRNA ribosyltransferase-isomerase